MAIDNRFIKSLTTPTLISGGVELARYPNLEVSDGLQLTDYPSYPKWILSTDNTALKRTFADVSASYLTLGTTSSLANERVLTAGTNITFTDAGAGGALTIGALFVGSSSLGVLATALPTLVGGTNLQVQTVAGYSGSLDGGEGNFVWLSGSSATADHGITFGSTASGRWKRIFDGPVSAKWYGAKGDNSTNDTIAMQRACVAASIYGGLLITPGTYKLTGSCVITSSVNVIGQGLPILQRSGSFNGPMLSIYGVSSGSKNEFAIVNGVGFDGTDSGTNVYGSGSNAELKIYYNKRVLVEDCVFKNTREYSLTTTTNDDVSVINNKFLDGAISNGSDSTISVWHVGSFYNRYFHADGNTFETDITYLPGDKTQTGAYGAPIAIINERNDYITLTNNKSYNAGNFEVYEANKNVIIGDNIFDDCQMPPIKVSNAQRINIENNIIIDPQPWWGQAIHVGAYTRLTTYGNLRPEQGVCNISNNIIKGCRADYGPIYVGGEAFSTTNLNTRISSQASYGYTTRNIVSASGADYYYIDDDGTVSGPIDQKYLLVRSVNIDSNNIDGFATTGIKTYMCDNVKQSNNNFVGCGNIDTSQAFTKAVIYNSSFNNSVIHNNFMSMPSGSIPTISLTASNMVGIMGLADLAHFSGSCSLDITNNTMRLTEVNVAAYIQNLKYFSFQDNDFTATTLITNGSMLKSIGVNEYGIVKGNRYFTTGALTTSTELSNFQSSFMSIRFEDNIHNSLMSKRVISAASDFTNPNQVACGYFEVGSTITVNGNQDKTYYLCTGSGYLAPAYAGGTAYSTGNKVVNGGEYFVALQTTTGNTPTASTGDVYWKILGTTAAGFTTVTL